MESRNVSKPRISLSSREIKRTEGDDRTPSPHGVTVKVYALFPWERKTLMADRSANYIPGLRAITRSTTRSSDSVSFFSTPLCRRRSKQKGKIRRPCPLRNCLEQWSSCKNINKTVSFYSGESLRSFSEIAILENCTCLRKGNKINHFFFLLCWI